VLLALGCALGGWSLHVRAGRLRYLHNLHGKALYEVGADKALGPGRHHVEFRFDKDEGPGGRAALLQDGALVGTGVVDRFTPVAYNEVGIGLTCGYEWGPAVGSDYEAPFRFNGRIVRAEVTTTGPVVRDPVAEVAAILAMQ
jgi:arylsulfatase